MARIASAAFATLAACSLGDFAGYSGGDELPDGASPDAPVIPTDGGADASSPVDDAGDERTDAASKFCELNADAGFFCEDFEGPAPLLHFNVTKMVGGTLAVEDGTMITDVLPGAANAYIYGNISPMKPGSSARLSFRVEPEVVNTTSDSCQIAKIYFFGAEGAPTYEVGVGIKAGSSALYTFEYTDSVGGFTDFGNLPPLAPNTMTELVLDVRIDAGSVSGPRVHLYRDGLRVVNAVLTPPRTSGAIEGFIGAPFVPVNHGAWKVRIDDILMSLPP